MKIEQFIKTVSARYASNCMMLSCENGTLSTFGKTYATFANAPLPDGIYSADTALKSLITGTPGEPIEEYPLPVVTLVEPVMSVAVSTLKDILPFAGISDIRYYINGVLMDAPNNAIVATNGNIMRKIQMATFCENSQNSQIKAIISRDFIEFAIKAKAEIIYLDKIGARFETTDGVAAQTNHVNGQYPDWQRVIPHLSDRPLSYTLPDLKTAKDWEKKAKTLDKKYPSIDLVAGKVKTDKTVLSENGANNRVTWGCQADYFVTLCKSSPAGVMRFSYNQVEQPSGVVFADDGSVSIIMPNRTK